MNEILPPAWLERVNWFFDKALAYFMADPVKIYLLPGIVLIVLIAIEAMTQKNWRDRYLSRNFRLDIFYYIFFYSGIYQFFIWMWVFKSFSYLFDHYLPALHLNLIGGLPLAVQIIALTIFFDFFHYWNHRIRHELPWLWAFHSIHHSQTQMTMMTTFRFHFVDETVFRLLMFIPFQILGFSPYLTNWLWIDIIGTWITGAQHANLNWSYGRFGRVFVSPYFHHIHHAVDEKLANRNYGGIFSCWDDLFGTAERKAPCPTEHGLVGNPVSETLLGHLVYPFVRIWRDLRKEAKVAAPVVPPAPPQGQAST